MCESLGSIVCITAENHTMKTYPMAESAQGYREDRHLSIRTRFHSSRIVLLHVWWGTVTHLRGTIYVSIVQQCEGGAVSSPRDYADLT